MLGMATIAVAMSTILAAPATAAGFGVESFTVSAHEADGTFDESAASHPFALDIDLSMDTDTAGEPEGAPRRVQVDLPPGLLGNPQAVPRCPSADFSGLSPECDGATQVGILRGLVTKLGEIIVPVYNLAPPPGSAAAFGIMAIGGEPIVEQLRLVGGGAGTALHLTVTLPESPTIIGIEEEIWGVPTSPAHDPERTCEGTDDLLAGGCVPGVERPFLTLPASCSEPLRTTLTATSYGSPSVSAVATALSRDAGGNPRPLFGCEAVPFEPRLTAATEGAASAPTSLGVDLEVPQYKGVRVTSAASLAALRLELPEGLALDPSAGSSLAACSPVAIGLESAPGVEPPVFGDGPASCPASSRLGSVVMQTPLLDRELDGAIYLATPGENPFGARYAFYLVIEDEETGTILKIPGRLDANPTNGRLTAVVPELPPLPFEKLRLEFVGGPHAPLASPPDCGRYSSEATFTPSTAPAGLLVARTSNFAISTGPGGASCPPPEDRRNATPSFQAGTEGVLAGRESALVIGLSRKDTDQHFGSFGLTLPPGLLADLSSVPVGAAVGSVRVEAGLGPSPTALEGTAYLGGPYEGAPYSLGLVVPAKVGPFDLGTIVVRAAVTVDAQTAQISVRTDPLPQILAGVPLQLRGLRIDLDRPGFIRNPTSCEPMAIAGTAISSLGQVVPLSSRFQVGACAALSFRPKLSLSLSGVSHRGAHPGVHVTFRPRTDDANLSAATVTLPPTVLLDTRHVKAVCPADRLAAGSCPSGALIGHATVSTPALPRPLEGNIYLRSSATRLPMLAVTLHGEVESTFMAQVDSVRRRIRFRLKGIPDVPLEKAALDLFGGRRGVIVDSGGVCTGKPRLKADLTAHNGRVARLHPRIAVRCGRKDKRHIRRQAAHSRTTNGGGRALALLRWVDW